MTGIVGNSPRSRRGRPGAPVWSRADLWTLPWVPVVALLLVLPLLRHGPSCGHDFGFHMQSWMDAAEQIRHGEFLPHWAYSPAFNAGEPRFIFYPPLSWLLGSVVLLLLPASVVPAAFTWVALSLAGVGMWALARRYTSAGGALLAATAYLVNPYMLFTAFERTAYAELLAAAWLPWLLRAALAVRVKPLSVAWPLALLWLTNAPAAVMGTYTLVLVAGTRWLTGFLRGRRTQNAGSVSAATALRAGRPLAGVPVGLALGLGLACFYLLPAALERRYVQIAMAIIPNMRVEDNFLFGHTGYGPHDQVLHTASLVAVSVLALTAVALAALLLLPRRGTEKPRRSETTYALWVLGGVIALLVWPFTLPVWHHVPELAFLQFPWRWMSVLGCVFGTAIAVSLGRTRIVPAVAVVSALALGLVCAPVALVPFRQVCEAQELPRARVALYAAHHGVGGTDEYTPNTADNDQLRWDDPAWWLTANPAAPGPGTVPNPASTIEDYDAPPPLDQTVSGRAPTHLRLQIDRPEDLVLNLRDYPAWRVTVNGALVEHLQRDDGLIAVALPPGTDTIDVRWRRLPEVWAGDGVSLCALCAALWIRRRSRRIRSQQ